MRYFLELSYRGTNYHGWQVQPNAITLQGRIEEAMVLLVGTTTSVVGCGRTDAGVHASQYYLHFDLEDELKRPLKFVSGLNALVGPDIAIHRIHAVAPDAHARFDALERSYEYHILLKKDPFLRGLVFHYRSKAPDLDVLNAAASLIVGERDFYTFSKTNSDVRSYRCRIFQANWTYRHPHHLVFCIRANRFLRGMVRLVVGMNLRVSESKMKLEDVREAMSARKLLKNSWSVPAEGLYLSEIKYPNSFNLAPDKAGIFP